MAQQVKFYSVAADATRSDANGIYFVTGGELYKGTTRFGLGRVTTVEDTSTLTSAARGDINIYEGTTKVFDGTNWVVAAESFTLPTFATGDSAGQVKLGSTNATVNGWSDLVASVSTNATNIASVSSALGSLATTVASVSGRVTDLEGVVSAANGGTVTASSATFTDLTVTSTATFSATTVSATTLTVGGVAVNNIASSTVTSSANGITVGVTTENGGVKAVTLDATSFGNVMHFVGVVSVSASVPASPEDGDIIVIGAATSEALSGIKTKLGVTNDVVQGQEYIYNGTGWELIGDQKTYAIESVVSASVSALQTRATNLETSMSTRASVGTGTATASYGVSGEVVLAANAQPTFSIAVAPVTTSAGITSTATTSLATAAAIKDYVDGVVSAATPATSTKGDSDKGIQVSVTTTSGVVTAVDVVTTLDTALSANADNAPTTKAVYDALCWCGANGQPLN